MNAIPFGRAARIAVLASLLTAAATAQGLDWQKNVGFDQHLGTELPLDAKFVDESGASVRLGDYFGDVPVVLAFVYYECPMLCDQVLNGMVSSLRAMSLDAGKDFQVVAISIDPDETPALAFAKRANYLKEYGRDGAEKGFHFLTGTEPEIKRATDAAGFRYVYDAETDQYAHAAGIVVATPKGTLSQYFLNVEFPPRDLRLGIVSASGGSVGSAVDQVLLFCFCYNPSEGRYSLAISRLIKVFAALTVGTLGGFVVLNLLRERRTRAHGEGAAT